MPSAVMHKEAGSALNPNQGCQQPEARLITARGPAVMIGCEAISAKLAGRTDSVDLAWPVQRLTFGVGQAPRLHVRP